ncbi:MAG: glycosyltransferase family 39 protein [Anaerolineae bacterium]
MKYGHLRRKIELGLCLLLILAFALRLYRLQSQSIWWDEGHSITVARHDLASIPTLRAMDVHPPLYFYLLHIWMGWAGESEFALRFLSLFFGLLALALLYRLGREMGGLDFGLMAAALGAFSPMYVAYSQEVRMYAMVTALSLLSNYFLYRLFFDEKGRSGILTWAGYVLFTALSLYTHYFFLFVLIFQNLFWVTLALLRARQAEENRKALIFLAEMARWGAGQLGVLALLSPQLALATRQIWAYENVNLSPPSLETFALQCWQAFTTGLTIGFEKAAPLMGGLALLLAVGLLPGRLAVLKRVPSGTVCFLSAWFFMPLLVYYLVLQRRASFAPRYMMLVTPALFLLLAFALWRMRRWLRGIGMALVLAVFVFSLHSYYFDEAYFKDDTRGLARFLEEKATERDVVFIDVPHPLDYYYPQGRYLFVDVHTIAHVLTEACQGKERLFFIRWRQSDTDPRGAVPFLLDKYGQFSGERSFRGYDAVWYRLPEDASFSLADFVPAEVNFGGKVALVGKDFGGRGQGETSTEEEVKRNLVPAGRKMWAALQWQVKAPSQENYKAALYLQDAWGHKIAQADKDLLNDRHLRSSAWNAGEVAINVYTLAIPPGTPPGEYALLASVYDPNTLKKLDVLDEAGAPQGTSALLGKMRVARPEVPPQAESLEIQNPLRLPLNEEIEFLGYDRAPGPLQPGEMLPLTLYWRARKDVQSDYLLSLCIEDEEGQTWGKEESRPVAGTYPTFKWRAGEIVCDRHDWLLPPDAPQGQYPLHLALINHADGEIAGEVDLGTLTIQGRFRLFEAPPISHPSQAILEDKVEFLGYDLAESQIKPGHTLSLTLYWRALSKMETSYKVFTHLLDGKSKIWGQKDSIPGDGQLPTTGWVPGEVIVDRYEIEVSPDAPPGEYVLEVGMYDERTGERLAVAGGQGGSILLGKVRMGNGEWEM